MVQGRFLAFLLDDDKEKLIMQAYGRASVMSILRMPIMCIANAHQLVW